MKNEKVARIIEITIRKVVKTTIRRNMWRKIDVNILISQAAFTILYSVCNSIIMNKNCDEK